MSYLYCTKHMISRGYVGDKVDNCHIDLFCDADFAGDKTDSKSVTGVLAAIVGPYFHANCYQKQEARLRL